MKKGITKTSSSNHLKTKEKVKKEFFKKTVLGNWKQTGLKSMNLACKKHSVPKSYSSFGGAYHPSSDYTGLNKIASASKIKKPWERSFDRKSGGSGSKATNSAPHKKKAARTEKVALKPFTTSSIKHPGKKFRVPTRQIQLNVILNKKVKKSKNANLINYPAATVTMNKEVISKTKPPEIKQRITSPPHIEPSPPPIQPKKDTQMAAVPDISWED